MWGITVLLVTGMGGWYTQPFCHPSVYNNRNFMPYFTTKTFSSVNHIPSGG